MQIESVICTNQEEWNAFVAQEPSFGLLQSWEWGEFKQKLGWKVFRIGVRRHGRIAAGAQLLIKALIPGLASVAYVPRGPVGDWLHTGIAEELLSRLHQISRSHRAVFLKVEPPLPNEPLLDRSLRQHEFRTSPHTNQPRATIILNLDQDLDDILMQMRKKTRQYVRKARRQGISIRIGGSEDLPAFFDIMRSTGRREHFSHRTREYYEHEWQVFAKNEQAVLLIALHGDQIRAMRTAYCFGAHAAELHAGSVGGPAEMRADYLLVWEAIRWAKAKGCRTYDLWGIPDEISETISKGDRPPASDRTDGLWGVYQFKRGFSKNVVCYIGAYDYVYSQPLYSFLSSMIFSADVLERAIASMDRLGRT